MKRRLFTFAVAAASCCSLLFTAQVLAASTNFEQKILPLNCQFEEVNDGTGTIIYLTPEQCGALVNPPPSGKQQAPSIGQQVGGVPQQNVTVGAYSPNRTVFFVQNNPNGSGNFTNAELHLPWQPIASVSSHNTGTGQPASTHNSGLAGKKTTIMAIAGVVVIVALTIFFI